jgi:hypothetical protein
MIINICPRCKSDDIEIRDNGFYGCKECGKTGKSYEVWVRIDIDGDPEVHNVRNILREMAGVLGEYAAPNLAIGLAKVLETYKTTVTPSIAREIISRAVSESFHTLYQMAVPFLPVEIQEDVQRLADLVTREQAAQREESHGEGEQPGGAAEDPESGGEAGGDPGRADHQVHRLDEAVGDPPVPDP